MYPSRLITRPVIYELGKKFAVVTNIRQASVTEEIGVVSIELDGDRSEIKKAIAWLEEAGIKVEPVEINTRENIAKVSFGRNAMTALLRIFAVLCAVAVIACWFSLGAHVGWTQTLAPVKKSDPVTEIEFTDYEARFILADPDGVDGKTENIVTVRTRFEPKPATGGNT